MKHLIVILLFVSSWMNAGEVLTGKALSQSVYGRKIQDLKAINLTDENWTAYISLTHPDRLKRVDPEDFIHDHIKNWVDRKLSRRKAPEGLSENEKEEWEKQEDERYRKVVREYDRSAGMVEEEDQRVKQGEMLTRIMGVKYPLGDWDYRPLLETIDDWKEWKGSGGLWPAFSTPPGLRLVFAKDGIPEYMIDVTTDYNKLLAESLNYPISFGPIHDKNEWDPDRVYIYKFRWEKTEGSLLLDKYFTYGVKKNEEYKREAREMWQHFNIRAYPEYGIGNQLIHVIFAPAEFIGHESCSVSDYCRNYLNNEIDHLKGLIKQGYYDDREDANIGKFEKLIERLPEIDKKWNEEK